jgi:hypothetical protein
MKVSACYCSMESASFFPIPVKVSIEGMRFGN